MRAPKFWNYGANSFLATCLSPLGAFYNKLTTQRAFKQPTWHAPIPVICVGNLIMGGAGKTPTAIALASYLKARGKNPYFLSRGYGGSLQGPLLVAQHTSDLVGDEPLLLSKVAPVCVSKNRILGAKKCVEAGCDVLIMDDGFQNPSLHKDLSLIVIDGGYGHGNEKVFPAGPLRETIQSGLKRAQACIIIGDDKTDTALRLKKVRPDLPLLHAHVQTTPRHDLSNKKLLAFAGIGRPEKFFETLKETNAEIILEVPFADHHPYTHQDIKSLQSLAKKFDASLMTTEKDWMRLPTEFRNEIDCLKITLEWDNPDMLAPLLSPLQL